MVASVTIHSTGEAFSVEAGETILAAAARQGVALPFGCANGTCGFCMSRIVQGRIDYPGGQPMALAEEDEADGKGLCCVGHPVGDLVIEPDHLGEEGEAWDERPA